MEYIVIDLVEVMKKEKTFLAREHAMMFFLIRLIQLIVQQAFEQLDKEVSDSFKKQGFFVDSFFD
jgi:hypothetical protein